VPPSDIAGDERSPLFRSAVRRSGTLAARAMHRVDAYRMIQRRAAELGLKVKIGCHTHGFWTDEDRPSLLHLHGSVHMGFAPPPDGDIGELLWFDDLAESLNHSSFSGSPMGPRMDGTSILRSPIVPRHPGRT
jgi:hypothetical protein